MNNILKGVRGELPLAELENEYTNLFSYGDYYDYEGIRAVILRKLNGEIDDEYFKTWCYFVSWALDIEEYKVISELFDGYYCENAYGRRVLLEMLAMLKDYEYKKNHADFIAAHKSEGKRVVYLRFLHPNLTASSSVFRAYFVDYKSNRFDIRMVDDAFFEYDDNLLYCRLWQKETDGDGFVDEAEIEYETQDERRLKSIFSSTDELWTYDHTLEL